MITVMTRKIFCGSFLSFYRSLCTSTTFMKGRFNLVQQSSLSRKFLKKSIFPVEKILSEAEPQIKSSQNFGRKRSSHNFRSAKLSKIFMEKITDIISTSDIYSQVEGCGLEITKVEVEPGLNACYIYWNCLRSSDERRINEVLVRGGPYITYELVLQGVLGRIPPLFFVRDDSYKNKLEVENCLQKADFGPDFEPSYGYVDPSTVMRDFREDSGRNMDGEGLNGDAKIGPLRQDVLGVRRGKIMESVKKGVLASKGRHRLSEEIMPFSRVQEIVKNSKNKSNEASYSRTTEIRKWASEYRKKRRKASLDNDNYSSFVLSNEFEDIEDLEQDSFLDGIDNWAED